MNRIQKNKILAQLLRGESARLDLAQRPPYQQLPPTQLELWAMSGEQLLALIESGIRIDYQKLPSLQLTAVLRAWHKDAYRDPASMSRQELKESITQLQQRLLAANDQPL